MEPMKIEFPYPGMERMTVPSDHDLQVFTLPKVMSSHGGRELVKKAVENPIGLPPLRQLALGKSKILIVADDITRPTPLAEFADLITDELLRAGVRADQIEFLMALGTHRNMTGDEIRKKLGGRIASQFKIHNHGWKDTDQLEYIGDTDQGAPVWINKMVSRADLVIGLGSIMPIEICGFTGGGKILIPGVGGQITVDEMHWTRIDVPSSQILGKADNPIRDSIDAFARKAGLDFIVNVVLNDRDEIVAAVAGDMVAAHRAGCRIAAEAFAIRFPHEFDIVIADSRPFDIDFWQANKTLDTAGLVVRKGGIVILIASCPEGLSRAHPEILKFGYHPIEKIKEMVRSGAIQHKVVGVHMAQVSAAAVEKAHLILVSHGISRTEAEKVGFEWAASPQQALDMALARTAQPSKIAVLRGAARMLPIIESKEHPHGI
jgi:lactate racemase